MRLNLNAILVLGMTCCLPLSAKILFAQEGGEEIEAAASPSEQIRDLTPKLTKEEKASIRKFYDEVSDIEPIRRVLAEVRRKQLADPLDQATHEILFASPEFAAVVQETLVQIDQFIRSSYIGHMGRASLAMPGEDGQLQDLLKQMEAVRNTGIYLFPSTAKLRVFAKQGTVNAYTWSGDPEHLDMAWFDGLLDLTAAIPGARTTIGGHEMGHIFFGHILQRIALDLIFHSTAKNLIPPERPAGDVKPGEASKETSEEKKALADLREVQLEALETWKKRFARELVPHIGKMMDEDSSLVANISDLMDRMSDRLTQRLGREGVEQVATDFYKAAMGLDAKSKVVITKDMEKKFEAALERLSNSQETSCDNVGRIVTQLLRGKYAKQESTEAFMVLMGSKYGKYPAMLKQIREYLSILGSTEGKAYRDVGQGHPNTVARAAAMFHFAEQHEAFRILTNPFLTLVADYLDLTRRLIELEGSTTSPKARELFDRQVETAQLTVIKEHARAMSSLIGDIVLREVLAVQNGQEKDLDSTIVLLAALAKASSQGARASTLASIADIRTELGKPGRLGIDLLMKLENAKRERAAIILPAVVPDPSKPDPRSTTVIDEVIVSLRETIPPSPIGRLQKLRDLATTGVCPKVVAAVSSAT